MTELSPPYQPRAKRFPVSIRIDASNVDMFLQSEIINLSKGGVFIRADLCLLSGSLVDLRFTLPKTLQVIQVQGIVVWSRKRGSHDVAFPRHPSGMGVQFQNVTEEHLRAIQNEIDAIGRLA